MLAVIEDQVRLARRVANLVEDTIRIEGEITVVKKTSTMSRTKGVGPGTDVHFETCQQVVILEESFENSALNDSTSFKTSFYS